MTGVLVQAASLAAHILASISPVPTGTVNICVYIICNM